MEVPNLLEQVGIGRSKEVHFEEKPILCVVSNVFNITNRHVVGLAIL